MLPSSTNTNEINRYIEAPVLLRSVIRACPAAPSAAAPSRSLPARNVSHGPALEHLARVHVAPRMDGAHGDLPLARAKAQSTFFRSPPAGGDCAPTAFRSAPGEAYTARGKETPCVGNTPAPQWPKPTLIAKGYELTGTRRPVSRGRRICELLSAICPRRGVDGRGVRGQVNRRQAG